MGKRTEYAPGTFSWTDLTTTDPDAAKSFYGELFGWEPDDMPAGEGMTYTMLKINGDYVAALSAQPEQFREQGVPPMWTSYVTVADADAAAAKARELGGTVHAEPFDVLDAGRMALIQDPTGAMLAVWQPKDNIGAMRVNDPGCMTWNELTTPDTDAALSFYSDLFGWEGEAMDAGDGPAYTVIRHGGRTNGGMMNPPQEGTPPAWIPYFTVTSTDQTAEKAGELGGSTLAGPMDAGPGRIAVIRDPQGAVFGVFEGETDPDPE